MLHIFIDADSCPMKPEVYRVAKRYDLKVTLVANAWMRVPAEQWISLEVVHGGFDAADDWIAEQVQRDDIVVTADILLAGRCLEKEASVLGTSGKPFTEDNITEAVATRALMAELREAGTITGGSAPLQASDRSLFLQELDKLIHAIKRKHPKGD